jgi:ADP-heptose:LPS heptosyltransferase
MLAGIGNAVMALPLVRELCRVGHVSVAARTRAIADVFGGLEEIARIEVLGSGHGQAWRRHRRLARALRPELYVVPFPSNRWQYSLLAAASGARQVIMHDYPVGGLRALRFLPAMLRKTTLVPAQAGLHDVVQNLRLLGGVEAALTGTSPAGGNARAAGSQVVEPPMIRVSEQDRAAARELLRGAQVKAGSEFIAIQPGCGDTPVGRAKRWPAEKFAKLIDLLAERGRDVVVIEGPEERGVGRQISDLSRDHPPVLELAGPLGHAAAVLEAATLYVGTDSGLAHVAAAVGTPPVTLFAAGDPVRVGPFGYEHLVVTPPPLNGRAWRPRLMYPMEHPGPRLRDAGGIDWAAQIRVQDVLGAIEQAQSSRLPRPSLTGSAAAAPC